MRPISGVFDKYGVNCCVAPVVVLQHCMPKLNRWLALSSILHPE